MNKLLEIIQTILQPLCWLRNSGQDNVWDRLLNELLDKEELVLYDKFTARIGKHQLWTSNYPYSYGNKTSGICTEASGLPSRATVRRLKKAVDAAKYKEWAK